MRNRFAPLACGGRGGVRGRRGATRSLDPRLLPSEGPKPPTAWATASAARWVNAVRKHAEGWVVLLSCSPGEESLEDVGWGLTASSPTCLPRELRGRADLNGDGLVSLAELIQYLADRVPKQAEAVLQDAIAHNRPTPPQQSQHPLVIWDGPIDVPLLRFRPQGARAVTEQGLPALCPLYVRGLALCDSPGAPPVLVGRCCTGQPLR